MERLRAPLAALLALLIGGDLAARGPSAFADMWRFLWPYLWLFLFFEAARARRRLQDAEAFLIGAGVGLLHGGAYLKILQDGVRVFGVDWLASITSAFDWGMVAVLALHAADALLPRVDGEEYAVGTPELAALALVPAAAVMIYLLDAATGRARIERFLGPVWLAADMMFAAAAFFLIRAAFVRAVAAEEEDVEPREAWMWALAAFCAWLPGAQVLARLSWDGPWPFLVLTLASWSALLAWLGLRLWRERGHADWTPRRASRPALAAAAWRLVGAALIVMIAGSVETNGRAAAAFTLFVDLPARLVFAALFLTGRLAV